MHAFRVTVALLRQLPLLESSALYHGLARITGPVGELAREVGEIEARGAIVAILSEIVEALPEGLDACALAWLDRASGTAATLAPPAEAA
jgi:hypothetical protein